MDKGKLKVLVMALKEIVEELESEVYSDVEAYQSPAVSYTHLTLPTIYSV